MDDPFFELDPYHILLLTVGGGLLLSYWVPRLVSRTPPAATALLMAAGFVSALIFPEIYVPIHPTDQAELWAGTSELVVIVVLFATGLRIDNVGDLQLWRPTIGLLAITMPLTIAAVALLGWWLAGMTIAGALLLGAVLAPTDPVLAGDIQVGPPQSGHEHPARFALTTEAGLNDGLAFPFVYLALHVAADGADPSLWLAEWLALDVLYRIGVGAVFGAAIGWGLGRILFVIPSWNTLAASGPGVLALAGVLVAYGLVELVEGYGFIAAFVAGVVCRRVEEGHAFHQRLHAFSESMEHAVTAVLLVLLGGLMPTLWPALDWRHAIVGFGLILVIRPLAGLAGLALSGRPVRERLVVAAYGVRGIGSVYYLGYAATHVEFIDEATLWAVVVFTIFASTVVHGLTARYTVGLLDAEATEPQASSSASQ